MSVLKWLSSLEIDTMTQVQNLDDAVFISKIDNTPRKKIRI